MILKPICILSLALASAAASAGSLETGSDSPMRQVNAAMSPGIAAARENGGLVLTFDGMLQVAGAPAGPWIDDPGASSPWRVTPSQDRMFYRARSVEEAGIFSSDAIVEWVIAGPLQTHFDLALAGVPDGFIPPKREKPYFDAALTMQGKAYPLSLRVRGNSSLQECPFPKLKLKFSMEQRQGTVFEEAREIKLGTHCAEGGTGNVGRLRDERCAYREALAYETMQLLGFTAPRVRRAHVEFRDSSPADAPNPGGWSIARKAFILEDVEVVADRLGGRPLVDLEIKEIQHAGFGGQLLADLRMLHILLGNWDFTLSEEGAQLWNTEVIQLADGKYIPMPGDFDLASWVTGKLKNRVPRDYHPEWPALYRQAKYDLEQFRIQVSAEVFNSAGKRFSDLRAPLESLVAAAEIDDDGRANAFAHLAAFFDALTP